MLNFHGVMIILLYFLIIMIILKFLIIIILLHFHIHLRKSRQVSFPEVGLSDIYISSSWTSCSITNFINPPQKSEVPNRRSFGLDFGLFDLSLSIVNKDLETWIYLALVQYNCFSRFYGWPHCIYWLFTIRKAVEICNQQLLFAIQFMR